MQRYFVDTKEDDYLILKRDDLHHIKNVMRNKIGDKIECIYDKQLYICQIESLESIKVRILSLILENNELTTNITIAIGLVKEQKMDLILQKLTELGVSRIIPVKMERSIIKIDEKRFLKKKERWNTICKEASEQSKRNEIPIIENIMSIDDLLKLNDFDLKFICSTEDSSNLITTYLKHNISRKKILCVIGPEGGITQEEERKLMQNDMIPISLGKRIMRVETAAIYIASIMNFCSLEE